MHIVKYIIIVICSQTLVARDSSGLMLNYIRVILVRKKCEGVCCKRSVCDVSGACT